MRTATRKFVANLAIALVGAIVLAGAQTGTAAFADAVTPATVSVSGNAAVGSTLSAVVGAWDPVDAVPTYRWLRGGTPITDATSETYTTVSADIGAAISVEVTGSADTFDPAVVTSSNSITVLNIYSDSATLSISSPAVNGQAVTSALSVPLSPAPDSVAYVWKLDGSVIAGAETSSYTPVLGDVAGSLTCELVVTKSGYVPRTLVSNAVTVGGAFTSAPTPTISGTLTVGSELTVSTGTWAPTPDDPFTYAWLADGSPIVGATSSTYTLTSDELGAKISVSVTGTKTGFTSLTKTSAESSAVTATFDVSGLPTISDTDLGTPYFAGHVLSVSAEIFTPTPTQLDYQWKRDGSAISGATSATYTVLQSDAGHAITVTVTPRLTNYTASPQTSESVSAVGAFTLTPQPTFTGTLRVGQTIHAVTGTWAPVPNSFDLQWLRDGVAISGATSANYTLTADDLGGIITLEATPTLSNYSAATQTSDPSTAVLAELFDTVGSASITGDATAVDDVLTAVPTGWSPTPDNYTYQWRRNGVDITDATSSTYTLTLDDLGETITVRVTATRNAFEDSAVTSSSRSIPLATFVTSGNPLITGTTAVGETLTVDTTDVFTPVPDTTLIKWYRNGAEILGETGTTYTTGDADASAAITVSVLARSAHYADVTLTSDASTITAEMVANDSPVVSDPTVGTPYLVGNTLEVSTDVFTPAATSYVYEWRRNGEAIPEATNATYTLADADAGAEVTVQVTGRRLNWTSASALSNGVTVTGEFRTTPLPTITGTVAVNETLTAHTGTWVPVADDFEYQWFRDGSPIDGATTSTYSLMPEDVDTRISVSTNALRTGFTSFSTTSIETARVLGASFDETGTATIDAPGTMLGDLLTATPSGWSPEPSSYAYQWRRDGVDITDATDSTYTITMDDLGADITVRVTAELLGYNGSTVTSDATSIPLGDFAVSGTPVVSGVAIISNTLTAEISGVFDPEPTEVTYVWLRNGVAIRGATTDSYFLTPLDSGKDISVSVTAKHAGYNDETVTSDVTTIAVAERYTVSATPTISGTPQVGRTLTAVEGTWVPTPTEFAYQWRRNGTDITDATSSTYELTGADLGAQISVTVTPFTENVIPLSRTSRSSSAVLAGSFALPRPIPEVSGTEKVGSTLTVSTTGWSPEPTSFTIAWLRNGVAISGATAETYTLAFADLNTRITARVTPVLSGYSVTPAISSATALIALGDFTDTPAPTISGDAIQGSRLTASVAPWTPLSTSYLYQWKRDGENIASATSGQYTVTPQDAGAALTVSVTGSRNGYVSHTEESEPTDTVPFMEFAVGSDLVLTGSPEVGGTISLGPLGVTPAPSTITYQWQLNGEDIDGATNATYNPTAEDLYADITVTVVASKPGYRDVTLSPLESVTVAEGNIGLLTAPVITGTPRVGRTLTATLGTWRHPADSFVIQWYRDGEPVGDPQDVSGSTVSSRYPVTTDDLEASISFGVVASKAGYTDEAAMSAGTAEVGRALFNAMPIPTITGTAKVGNTLTAVTGAWSPNATSFVYQWTRDGSEIVGAISPTYVLQADDAGRLVRVSVLGVRSGYDGETKTSLPTAAVALGTFSAKPIPTVGGVARVGSVLTATSPAWTPVATFTYQWKRNGVNIGGATSSTYTLVAADLGKTISVSQVGARSGYVTTTVSSVESVPVVAGVFSAQPTPTISGTPKVGFTLTASTGSWLPTPTFAYQWKRGSANISGATRSTYVLQPEDAGTVISVAVTATKTAYTSVTKSSAGTSSIEPLLFVDTVKPTISGLEKVEGILTASPGTWDPVPTSWTYQWKRDGDDISGATAATYTLIGADAGATISVEVTGSKVGYTSVTETSDESGEIATAQFSASPAPTVSGTPKVGVPLSVVTGTWKPAPVTFTYQWLKDGVEIGGATSSSYTPIADDLDGKISVTLTANKLGYDEVVLTSAETSAVVKGDFAAVAPTIAGTPKVGVPLTATPGTWTPTSETDRTYQWKRAGVAISGATTTTYTPTADDQGKRLTFEVSGTRTGYNNLTKPSVATAVVAKGTFTTTPTPVINGPTTPSRVGQVLTASVGAWVPAESAVVFQWKRNGVDITGQIASSYTTVAADLGAAITVTTTASRAGYVDSPMTSAARTIGSGLFDTHPVPTISGDAKMNSLLTATVGSWSPAPSSTTLQWKRAGVSISGATNSTYTLTADDVDKVITVTVTTKLAGYTDGLETSAPTASVAKIPFDTPATPTITPAGVPAVGVTLTAVPGTATPTATTKTYVWKRAGVAISGATGATYKVSADDFGAKITVTVVGSRPGYTDYERTSLETDTVIKGTLSPAPNPTISPSSVPAVGVALTATAGTWGPAPVATTFQWFAADVAISGATTNTYTPRAEDVGKAITVKVTGAKTGYDSRTQVSTATSSVINANFSSSPTPTITGSATAKVGVMLSAVAGTWLPTPDGALSYQWKRNGTPISLATSATYTPVADDRGQVLTVEVSASKAGYNAKSVTSAGTATVAWGTLSTPATKPAISGTTTVGQTLTTTDGSTWPVGTTFTYQWKRNGVAISGATFNTYTLQVADRGTKITVTVTGALSGYTSLPVTSNQTATIS